MFITACSTFSKPPSTVATSLMAVVWSGIDSLKWRTNSTMPNAVQPCASVRAVFDSKTGLYWTELPLTKVEFPVTVRNATYARAGTYGRVEHADEINKWIDGILQGAPASMVFVATDDARPGYGGLYYSADHGQLITHFPDGMEGGSNAYQIDLEDFKSL